VVTPSFEPDVLAAVGAMIVARAADLKAARAEAENLREQLESRKLLERAKGVLMRKLGIPEEAAYRRMQKASQDENRKLKQIAESILSAEKLLEADKPGEDPRA
jgi:response regulator NasT